MTNDGTAAVIAPATTVTVTGLEETTSASRWKHRKIPKQQRRASSFGKSTRSEAPNHAPESKRPSQRPTTRRASHAGSEKPSTGAAPGWRTGPSPEATERA